MAHHLKLLRSSRILAFVATALVAIPVTVPGSRAFILTGLPIFGRPLFLVVALLILLWTVPWQARRWSVLAVILGLSVLATTHLIGAQTLPYGYDVCVLRTDATREGLPITEPCEPSVESRSGAHGFRYADINFSNNRFPLYFMNGAGFNFYRDTEPNRTSLPYRLTVTALFAPSRSTEVRVETNIPAVSLSLDGQVSAVDGATTVVLEPGAVRSLVVSYLANRADGHYLRVSTGADPFYRLHGGRLPSHRSLVVLQLLNGGALLLAAAALLAAAVERVRTVARANVAAWVIAAGVTYAHVWVPEAYRMATFAFLLLAIVWLALLGKESGRGRLLPQSWWLLLIAFLCYRYLTATLPPLILYQGGNDEYGHALFAREVLLAPNIREMLRGPEAVFYYQPLYRYVAALPQALFGEANWSVYFTQLFFVALGVYLAVRYWRASAGTTIALLWSMAWWVLSWNTATSPIYLATVGLQQSLATPLFLISIYLVLAMAQREERRPWVFGLLGLLYGLVMMLRTDYLPAVLGLLIFLMFFWIRKVRNDHTSSYSLIAAALAGFAIFPFLVWLHNWVFGGVSQFLPTSGLVNIAVPFRHVIWDPYISRTSGLYAMLLIVRSYSSDGLTFARILIANLTAGTIGTDLLRMLLWGGVVSWIGVLNTRAARTVRVPYFLLLGSLVPLVVTSLFYEAHNGLAMRVHVDQLLLAILTLLWAVALGSSRARNPRTEGS